MREITNDEILPALQAAVDDVIDKKTEINSLSQKALCKSIEDRFQDRLVTDCDFSVEDAKEFLDGFSILAIVKAEDMIPGFNWGEIEGKWPTTKATAGSSWFGSSSTDGMKGWGPN